jgi:hypothetical protein
MTSEELIQLHTLIYKLSYLELCSLNQILRSREYELMKSEKEKFQALGNV